MAIGSIVATFGMRMLLLFPSIILHEVAHGYAAYKMGDDTAKRAGRLTLNPVKHIDLWGTILLPAILLIASNGSFAFGFAKPVPINPYRFKNQREGMLITGIAGPATNIGIAVIFGLLVRFLMPASFGSNFGYVVATMIVYLVQMNLMLAFFNLVPIPPLDGSRVLQRFLPDRMRDAYHSIEPYGFALVIGLTYFVPSAFQTYMSWTVDPIFHLITGL